MTAASERPVMTAEELDAAQREMATRMVAMIEALVAGGAYPVAIGGIMLATTHLLTKWASPGRVAALLITYSDYLANTSAEYPVSKPL
jgi:hypothetical protein